MSEKRCPELDDITVEDLNILIDRWIIGRHGERNRKIMRRNLIDGIGFEPLAAEFDLSVRQVKNIVYKGEDKIFSKI